MALKIAMLDCTLWMVSPGPWSKLWTGCSITNTRQYMSFAPGMEVRQVVPEDAPLPEEWQDFRMQLSELVKEIKDQRELMKQMRELIGELKDHASLPRWSQTPVGDGKPTR
jgi:hypothetical protein